MWWKPDTAQWSEASRRGLRWALAAALFCALFAIGWWIAGKRLWTDGQSLLITSFNAVGPAGFREIRVPRPGWNALVLVGALALTLPLIRLLRTSEGRDLLSKCLLVSLLVHVILAMLFSAVSVSRDIIQYVKEEVAMEVPLNLEASRVAELQLQVRNQVTDLPAPPPAEGTLDLPRVAALDVRAEPPAAVEVSTPPMNTRPGAMAIHVEPPRVASAGSVEVAGFEPDLGAAMPPISFEVPPPQPAEEPAPNVAAPRPDAPRPAAAPYNPPPQSVASTSVPVKPTRSPMIAAPSPVAHMPQPDATIAQPTFVPEVQLPIVSLEPGASPLHDPDRAVTPAPPLLAIRQETGLPDRPSAATRPAGPVVAPGGSSLEPAIIAARPPDLSLDITLPLPIDSLNPAPAAPPPAPVPTVAEAPRPTPSHRTTGQTIAPTIPLVPIPSLHPPGRDPRSTGPAAEILTPPPLTPLDPPAPEPGEIALSLPGTAGNTPPLPLALPDQIGPTDLAAPEPLAQRSAEMRRPIVEELGGSMETEAAVARALAYLARNQQSDGRWTRYSSDRTPLRNREEMHDVALTGLAVLCFLAGDHTPNRDGPYRQAVSRGLDYLLRVQTYDGNGRGAGNMYDQAISTIALAEAAVMTKQDRYRVGAEIGARYILEAQNSAGSWRYWPLQGGDMSVTGWQIMALHSAAQAGFSLPDARREQMLRWLDTVSSGKTRILGSYLPGQAPSASMTAQAVFSRLLLNQPLRPEQVDEASAFVTRALPGSFEKDFYQFYSVSLMLMQFQNEPWRRWNLAMRGHLASIQRRDGAADGSWDPDNKWAEKGGRIYSTSLATLTLQVYYRYLPMYTAHPTR